MTTPHDALFKHVFADPANTAPELRALLPQALVQCADWSRLVLASGTFVDEALSEHHSDLLFRLPCAGEDALVYVLLEHKGAPDALTPLQLLRYMIRVWEQHVREVGLPLPVIVPVVLRHGSGGGPATTQLLHLFALERRSAALGESLRSFVPDFRFLLDDLRTASAAELDARELTIFARLALACFQELGAGADLLVHLERLGARIRALLLAHGGRDALEALLRYILCVHDVPEGVLADLLRRTSGPEGDEALMTTFDRIFQRGEASGLERGRRAGLEEGLVAGQRALLLRLLATRFGDLTGAVTERIAHATLADLQLWAERVLDARALDDVFG